ncbi:MAG TPA: hypothetical protein VIP53_10185 [Nitrososphaera sp.]
MSLSKTAAIERKDNRHVTFCAVKRSFETGEITEMQLIQTYRSEVIVVVTVQNNTK